MIDLEQYRLRIGGYSHRYAHRQFGEYNNMTRKYNIMTGGAGNVFKNIFCVLLLMIYVYLLSILMALFIKISLKQKQVTFSHTASETYLTVHRAHWLSCS